MTRTGLYSVTAEQEGRVLRLLAVLLVAVMMLALWPLADRALAQEGDSIDDPSRACPSDVPASDFTDRDAIPHVHLCNVDRAAHLDIVAGFTDGEYKPHRGVSREQMASFIFRTLRTAQVELPPAGEERFADVAAGSAHDETIHRLAAAGVLRGGPLHLDDDRYGPNLLIRRDQMASFLMRGIGYAFFDDPDHFQDWPESAPEDAVLSEFPDVPRSNSHYGNVHAGNFQAVVLGFPDGTFRPGATHRRDQMGSSVVRALFALSVPTHVEITEQTAETEVVGVPIVVTATVTDQLGAPWGGFAEVHWNAEGEGVAPEQESFAVGDDGRSSFEFTSNQEGPVTVTASIDGPGGNFTAADGESDTVQVHFADEVPQTTVSVFFSQNGGEPCGEVFPVDRQVPAHAPLRGVMQELLAGPTEAEAAEGYWSWFSSETEGMLNSVRIADGTAHVDFADFSEIIPNASTSCGSAILLGQLDSTAEQFDTVDEARYSFNGDEAAFYGWLQLAVPE